MFKQTNKQKNIDSLEHDWELNTPNNRHTQTHRELKEPQVNDPN